MNSARNAVRRFAHLVRLAISQSCAQNDCKKMTNKINHSSVDGRAFDCLPC